MISICFEMFNRVGSGLHECSFLFSCSHYETACKAPHPAGQVKSMVHNVHLNELNPHRRRGPPHFPIQSFLSSRSVCMCVFPVGRRKPTIIISFPGRRSSGHRVPCPACSYIILPCQAKGNVFSNPPLPVPAPGVHGEQETDIHCGTGSGHEHLRSSSSSSNRETLRVLGWWYTLRDRDSGQRWQWLVARYTHTHTQRYTPSALWILSSLNASMPRPVKASAPAEHTWCSGTRESTRSGLWYRMK